VFVRDIFYSEIERTEGGIMGRTILYILIGISVVGALAVMLLMAPMTDEPSVSSTSSSTSDIASESTTTQEPAAPAADTTSQEVSEPESTQTPSETAAGTETAPPSVPVDFTIDGTISSGEYAHETTVAGVDVYYSNDASTLRVGLVSPGTGFVSIGFDPERQMQGANFIIGAVNEGELTIRDDYGFEPYAHIEDTARGGSDDIIAAAGNEWPDQTVIEFMIPLDSGDPMDKPLLPGHSYTILTAYHSLSDSFTTRHTRRGSGTIQLDLAP
jgi:hypothetical protein